MQSNCITKSCREITAPCDRFSLNASSVPVDSCRCSAGQDRVVTYVLTRWSRRPTVPCPPPSSPCSPAPAVRPHTFRARTYITLMLTCHQTNTVFWHREHDDETVTETKKLLTLLNTTSVEQIEDFMYFIIFRMSIHTHKHTHTI